MSRATFAILIVFIVAISAYDSLRCVVDAEHLASIELNPMARSLIDGEDVSRLICGKAFGVGLVVGVLCELRASGYRHSSLVTVAVAVAQAAVAAAYLL